MFREACWLWMQPNRGERCPRLGLRCTNKVLDAKNGYLCLEMQVNFERVAARQSSGWQLGNQAGGKLHSYSGYSVHGGILAIDVPTYSRFDIRILIAARFLKSWFSYALACSL